MDVRKKILEKYNTGQRYTFPGAIDYNSGKIPAAYWCEMSIVELLRYYTLHLYGAPTYRCYECCADPTEKVIRINEPADEEMDWLGVEVSLSSAINNFFGGREGGMVKFVLREKRDE